MYLPGRADQRKAKSSKFWGAGDGGPKWVVATVPLHQKVPPKVWQDLVKQVLCLYLFIPLHLRERKLTQLQLVRQSA